MAPVELTGVSAAPLLLCLLLLGMLLGMLLLASAKTPGSELLREEKEGSLGRCMQGFVSGISWLLEMARSHVKRCLCPSKDDKRTLVEARPPDYVERKLSVAGSRPVEFVLPQLPTLAMRQVHVQQQQQHHQHHHHQYQEVQQVEEAVLFDRSRDEKMMRIVDGNVVALPLFSQMKRELVAGTPGAATIGPAGLGQDNPRRRPSSLIIPPMGSGAASPGSVSRGSFARAASVCTSPYSPKPHSPSPSFGKPSRSFSIQGSEWNLRIGSPGASSKRLLSRQLSVPLTMHPQSPTLGQLSPLAEDYGTFPTNMDTTYKTEDSFDSGTLEDVIVEGGQPSGKLHVQLRYDQTMQHVWIMVVQVQNLVLKPSKAPPSIYVKGTVLADRRWTFKTNMKPNISNPRYDEMFVFNIEPKAMQTAKLELQVATRKPRKEILGKTTISLHSLGEEATDHWLELFFHHATMDRGELCVSSCLDLQKDTLTLHIKEARDLRKSYSTTPGNAFVKATMLIADNKMERRQTPLSAVVRGGVSWNHTISLPAEHRHHKFLGVSIELRVFYRDSLRRAHLLGQVTLNWDAEGSCLEQWKETIRNPDKVLTYWHKLNVPDSHNIRF
ncbi:synaptotagmin-6-like [Lampetra fluviatilis]